MSWNAAQILKSIKNGTNHSKYTKYFIWKTPDGAEVWLAEDTAFMTVEKDNKKLFADNIKLKAGEMQTIERIILRHLLK